MNLGVNNVDIRHEFVSGMNEIRRDQWNQLKGTESPFLRYQYLRLLEDSQSASSASGWTPCHLIQSDSKGIRAAIPLYRKTHSYGEYVFDWRWAEAYQQTGEDYFPKLLTAIPFTPVPGARILYREDLELADVLPSLVETIQKRATSLNLSSWHLLFPEANLHDPLLELGMLHRNAVQFHWFNKDFENFDQFLGQLRSSKRKQIRRERRRVAEQGVLVKRVSGADISADNMREFYACYCDTYLKRSGHSGYLTREFFDQLLAQVGDQVMLVLAQRNEQTIAGSLFFFDNNNLYGRYWGAIEDIDCLHFECCYYQGIEFAIEQQLNCFNPGTQGEHKLVRGFEPVKTSSYHWIKHKEFSDAVESFLASEKRYTDQYKTAAEGALPFRKSESPQAPKSI